jgi:hypothetical protein
MQHSTPVLAGRERGLVAVWLGVVLLAAIAFVPQHRGDWSFFQGAAETLTSSRWRFVYVDNPDSQTGPITIALAAFVNTPAMLFAIALCGVAVIAMLTTSGHDLWRVAIAGTAVAVWWPQLGAFGHLDDALVATLACAATYACLNDRRYLTAVLAGLAIGVKPTAVFLLALTWRDWKRTAISVVVAGVVWVPFVTAPGALDAIRPTLVVQPDAVISLFVRAGTEPSGSLRIGQLLAVVAVAVWAMIRVGPAAVLATGVATRLLLDPVAWPYYTPTLVLGAAVWELQHRRGIPYVTVAVAVLLPTHDIVANPDGRLWLRVVACLLALTAIAFSNRQRLDAPFRTEIAVERRHVGV